MTRLTKRPSRTNESVFVELPGPPRTACDINGWRHINDYRGTWHMPLSALRSGRRSLVTDQLGSGADCEERIFEATAKVCTTVVRTRSPGA